VPCRGKFGDDVRYDSKLSTALSLDADDAAGRTAQWRQLVDLVVQANGNLNPLVRDEALTRINDLRMLVPIRERHLAALQLASRIEHRDGVALFALDEPFIAAPILTAANLDGESWPALIAQMPPASRAILRNRRDLPEDALRALASYGLTDFQLPASAIGSVEAGTQIRDLVARIEAFRLGSPTVGMTGSIEQANEFNFETAVDGLFDWVAGVPREALIGLSIAEIADAGGCGVDGQAAGAFRRRAPFIDARLRVAGRGVAAGDWLISAKPVFNPFDGRFAGYHGLARRPRADEVAGPVAHFAGTTMPVDSLRQLIHELRTPLNAILGFAEMIDRQLLGPAALAYRQRAQAIVLDGERLLTMVDDLDQAARARRDAAVRTDDICDAGAMLVRIESTLQPTLAARDIRLAVTADPVDVIGASPIVIERMMARLIGASIGLVAAGETISVTLSGRSPSHAILSVARPNRLAGIPDKILLDPGYDPEMPYPDAPLLGLGFTLRLLESLARDIGGRFVIGADRFDVLLPRGRMHADLPAGTP
jgi:signal transduction histidine kinase